MHYKVPVSDMQHKYVSIMVGCNGYFFFLGFVLSFYEKLLSLFAENFKTVSALCYSNPLI